MNRLFLRRLSIDWQRIDPDSYLQRIQALKQLESLEFHSPITFFAGENGTGKSTLLEAIAGASGFNIEGGTRNYRFSTYAEGAELSNAIRLVRGAVPMKSGFFFRAESFFNVASATALKYNDDGRLPDYHAQSHGESFLSFLQRSDGRGLFLMDEPEAALSPQRQLTLLIHVRKMADAGAQFIAATHSPILLGIPGAEILSFDGGKVHPCDYEDTESYQITKLFLNDRQRMLHMLMSDDSP